MDIDTTITTTMPTATMPTATMPTATMPTATMPTTTMPTATMTIDGHFNGPPGSGHGGTAAGGFAAAVEPDAASVRFHRPIPLDVALVARPGAEATEILDDGTVIATVRELGTPLRVGAFDLPSEEQIAQAEPHWLDRRDGQHMAPTCFACGHERHRGGLGLRPGPIGDGSVLGCRWRPEGSGRVPSWLVWAAMDCPTGFPALTSVGVTEAVVTGELAVQVLHPVQAGVTHRIMSRRVSHEGRRHVTEAALYGPTGRRLALATATWITVPLPTELASAA